MRNTANKQKCRKYEGELREKTGNLISWGKSASAQERLGPRKRWVRVWVWEEVEKMHLSPNSGPGIGHPGCFKFILNSCPLSWWCHPTISSSVIPFSSCLQSFPASGSFQTSQLKRTIARHVVIKMTKIKDKERILKAAREKQQSYIQGNYHEDARWLFRKKCRPGGSCTIYLKWWKRKAYIQEYSPWQGLCSDLMERSKSFTEKQKPKEFRTTKAGFTRNVQTTTLREKEKATTRTRELWGKK